MEKQYISSLQNPQVKAWRTLREAKGRAEQGLFLAEGDHLTGEALTANAAAALLVSELEEERYQSHLMAAQAQGLPVYVLSQRAMAAISDAKTPQGVAAVCKLPTMNQALPQSALKIAALDGVQDPGNVGTMLRTLDAAGFDAMLLGKGTADPFSPKALRATMGAVFRVPVYACDLPAQLQKLSQTHDLYAGALDGKPFFERVRMHEGVCVIIGNEGAGISDAVYAVPAIQRVKLPMQGGAESLNASVAGAIMVYDVVRRGE